jgi:hypothetical protein
VKNKKNAGVKFIDNEKNAALWGCATDCKVQSLNFNNKKNIVQHGNK